MERLSAWITGILLGVLAFFSVAAVCYLPIRLFCSAYRTKLACIGICTWIAALAIITIFAFVFSTAIAVALAGGGVEHLPHWLANVDNPQMVWAVGFFGRTWEAAAGFIWPFVLVLAMVTLVLAWFVALFVTPSVLPWVFFLVGMWVWSTRVLPNLGVFEGLGRPSEPVGLAAADDPRWHQYRRD